MDAYHNAVPGLTPTMLRFLWKTHRMRILHDGETSMTVRITDRENGRRYLARFAKRPGSGALWQLRDPHKERGRLAFLDIEPHLVTDE